MGIKDAQQNHKEALRVLCRRIRRASRRARSRKVSKSVSKSSIALRLLRSESTKHRSKTSWGWGVGVGVGGRVLGKGHQPCAYLPYVRITTIRSPPPHEINQAHTGSGRLTNFVLRRVRVVAKTEKPATATVVTEDTM